MAKFYKTRSSAIRAAKQACKRLRGDCFEAAEAIDFHIWPDSVNYQPVFKFEIV